MTKKEERGEGKWKQRKNSNVKKVKSKTYFHENVMADGSYMYCVFSWREKRIKKRQSRYDFAVLYLRFRKDYSAGFSSALGASAAGASALGAAAAAGAAGFASAAGAAGLLPVITPLGHLFAQMPQDLHLL